MNQSDILRAVRNRTPDSFAPDGQPLKFVPVVISSIIMSDAEVDQYGPERCFALSEGRLEAFRKQMEG